MTLAAITANEVLGLLAVLTAYLGVLGALMFAAFRRQFISEREELRQIRDNSRRLVFLADTLIDGFQNQRTLIEHNFGLIHSLETRVTGGPDERTFLAVVENMQSEADRSLHELLVLSEVTRDQISGASHLAEGSARVQSLRMLKWRVGATDDAVVRRTLHEHALRLEKRLDSNGR